MDRRTFLTTAPLAGVAAGAGHASEQGPRADAGAVASIAALKAFRRPEGMGLVRVGSGAEDGDGLGGLFYYDPSAGSAPDGFTRIAGADGAIWSRVDPLRDFAARSRAVAARALGWVPGDGYSLAIGDLVYQGASGATDIADLPGLVPVGDVSPRHFGADPTGGTPCGDALQGWLDFLQRRPSLRGIVDGVYLSDRDLVIRAPVTILGFTWGTDTKTASGPGASPCAIVAGKGVSDLLTCSSEAGDQRLYDITLRGFALRGENIAARLLVMRSTYFADLELYGERARKVGLEFTDGGTLLSAFNMIHMWRYNAGSHANCRLSHGLKIDGRSDYPEASTGCTQFYLGQVGCDVQTHRVEKVTDSGGTAVFTLSKTHHFEVGESVLVYNSDLYKTEWAEVAAVPSPTTLSVTGVPFVADEPGALIAGGVGFWLGDCDSSYIARYQGDSLYLLGDRPDQTPPRRASRKNTFSHVGAKIIMGDGARNTIDSINSEPSGITIFGEATLDAAIIDRVTGAVYQTETYSLSDQFPLQLRDGFRDGAVTEGLIDGRLPRLQFSPDDPGGIFWQFALPRTWDRGTVRTLTLDILGTAGDGEALFEVQLSASAVGEAPAPAADRTVRQALRQTGTRQQVDIALDVAVDRGDLLSIGLTRLSDLAADTLKQETNILAAALVFEGRGPQDRNVWDIPALRVR